MQGASPAEELGTKAVVGRIFPGFPARLELEVPGVPATASVDCANLLTLEVDDGPRAELQPGDGIA